jgi:predicted lipid-binding transport protein (Tim44 family)
VRRSRAAAFALAGAVVVAALVVAGAALARPGGGQGFSGGGGGGGGGYSGGGGGYSGGDGGGGGGDGSGIIFLAIQLAIQHPVVGIPLLALAIGFYVWRQRQVGGRQNWSAGVAQSRQMQGMGMGMGPPGMAQRAQMEARTRSGLRGLEDLRRADANFSIVLFEDFLYALYAEVHTARGRGQMARLSAYVSPEVVQILSQPPFYEVRDIIVGAMHFKPAPIQKQRGYDYVAVEFEANYTQVLPQGPQSYYVNERWTLARKMGVVSRTPDRIKMFGCPNCGAPQDAVIAGACSYCKQNVSTGDFDWNVRTVELLKHDPQPPTLTSYAEERGTQLPTIVDPMAVGLLAELKMRDAAFDWMAFQARVGLVFNQFQVAWTARDLGGMRPFLSDNLFGMQVYWVEQYKRQRLRNVIQNPRILSMELARVTSDKFFDAITVRLFAESVDFVASDDNRVVAGKPNKPRRYSEYWSFIRGRAKTGPTRTEPVCPNCGAALKINMAGYCEYCRAKVTSGDFDWVLSRIEQDEVYSG